MTYDADAIAMLAAAYGAVAEIPMYVLHCAWCKAVLDENTKLSAHGNHFCGPGCWDKHDAAQYVGELAL